jgi:type II restriction enzyme
MCERAINDVLRYGNALLKFISANDAGQTGSHQCGFYLPKSAWRMFTPHPPRKERLDKHRVNILWPDGRITESDVTWYGRRSRQEYRLTRFGKDFPWLTADSVGDLLVLIPKSDTEFIAYVLDNDEDIEEIQASLGVEIVETWGIYQDGIAQVEEEDEDACLDRRFRAFAEAVEEFPEGAVISKATREAIVDCIPQFGAVVVDKRLLRIIKEEYRLFRMIERKIFQPEVQRLFASLDDFIETAMKILQARRSRAGRALENHVEHLFTEAGIPFQMRQIVDDTRPDVIIPSKAAYDDPQYPLHKLMMIGVKTTCKDRWRQVTKEAPRIPIKHILTLQEGVSRKQLEEMRGANVTLIVPQPLHKKYPDRKNIKILDLNSFIASVKRLHYA